MDNNTLEKLDQLKDKTPIKNKKIVYKEIAEVLENQDRINEYDYLIQQGCLYGKSRTTSPNCSEKKENTTRPTDFLFCEL